MELEELKRTWMEFEGRIDRQLLALNHHNRNDFQQRQRTRVRRGLWPLFWGQIALIAFGAVLIIMAAMYWSANRNVPHRLITGIIIHVYGAIVIMMAGITLGRLSRIDYQQSVVVIQQRLAELRRWYIFAGAMTGLPWWLLWLPFVHVVFGLFGADMLGNVSTLFIWSNVAVGVLGLFGTRAFHRWLHQPGRESLAERMDDNAAGRSLNHVRRLLADLESSEVS